MLMKINFRPTVTISTIHGGCFFWNELVCSRVLRQAKENTDALKWFFKYGP